jgi:hypothetical protein
MSDDKAAKLAAELDELKNSLAGNRKMDINMEYGDMDPKNSKTSLFILAKDFYKFSLKALDELKKVSADSSCDSDVPALVRKEITDLLPGLLKEALSDLRTAPVSASNVTVTSDQPSETYSLFLERQVVGDEEPKKISHQEYVDVVKRDLKTSVPTIPILKTQRHEVKGAVNMTFSTKEHRDSAKEALESKYKATSKTTERKKLDPKLTMFDLEAEYSCGEDLEKKILEKNQGIRRLKEGELFKVVFLDKKTKDFAVLQVSSRIRQCLRESGDWIHVDLRQHRVRDRYHVVQCFDCQEYGHMSGSPYCKKKSTPVCSYCAGSHTSKDCQRRKSKDTAAIKCSNCSHSNNKREKDKCRTHTAADRLCPFHVKERAQIMGRTFGSDEAKNYYVQRSRDLQKELGIN